ncbi:MAG TPA: MFS transporter [Candidatus Acidoferrales bacterium]|nr:MFS transporter [Candidatus Acidoferrales bacterium]
MRIASGASGVLVGLYLAELANRGFGINAALVGTLGAVSFGAELIASIPMGIASDAVAPRALMTSGALLGAMATQLFGMSSQTSIFFLSRTVEGMGAAAVTPSLLSHLTDVTDGNHSLRARVMSYFELSLLAGLALGGLVGAQLWHFLSVRAFGAVAAIYVLSACLLLLGAVGSRGHGSVQAISGFYTALKEPSLQRLAPVWLCVNTIVGLWLGPTLPFLLTRKGHSSQFLDGIFANQPERIGWLLLGYSMIFGIGVTAWSIVLPRMTEQRALRIALVAMVGVCLGLYLLNHSGAESPAVRWEIGTVTALCIMVESGFTPAALSLLAGAIGAHAGRGAAMGIYSVLLSIGAIVGSLLAAALGQVFAVDGLIYSTFAMAVIALFFVRWLRLTNSEERLNVETTV